MVEIRDSREDDAAALETLYASAFPDEDLVPLLRALLRAEEEVLSLVAIVDRTTVGHVAFTACDIGDYEAGAALLGPLAVAPDRQREGIGSRLVRAGLHRLGETGVGRVFVLGDPAYYARFGFAPDGRVHPPYPIPPAWAEAWQSVGLGQDPSSPEGTLAVPPAWQKPDLWMP